MSLSSDEEREEWLVEIVPLFKMRYVARIAYQGRGYIGWQRQTNVAQDQQSIQHVIELAIAEMNGLSEITPVSGLSRTDAGTHALNQIATFELNNYSGDCEDLRQSLNTYLPLSIRIHALEELRLPPGQRCLQASVKKYVYYIEQAPRPRKEYCHNCWFTSKQLNLERMKKAFDIIRGHHDFRHFSMGLNSIKHINTFRTLMQVDITPRWTVEFSLNPATSGTGEKIQGSELDPETGAPTSVSKPYFICIELYGTGFLRHMVRRLIGSVRPIAEGTQDISNLHNILNGSISPGPSAPARGLWLQQAWLTDEEWYRDFHTWPQDYA